MDLLWGQITLNNPVSFCDEMTGSVDKGRVTHPDFNVFFFFSTRSPGILTDKLQISAWDGLQSM